MENPNTWNDVQRLIERAITKWEDDAAEGRIGFSLPTFIYNALNEAHMIKEEFCVANSKPKPKTIVMTEEGLPTTRQGEMGKDESSKAIVRDGNGEVIGRQD